MRIHIDLEVGNNSTDGHGVESISRRIHSLKSANIGDLQEGTRAETTIINTPSPITSNANVAQTYAGFDIQPSGKRKFTSLEKGKSRVIRFQS